MRRAPADRFRPVVGSPRKTAPTVDGRTQMNRSRHALRTGALCGAILVALLAGCSKNDPIAKAEKTDATKPSIAETKAIAEEGSSTACRS